MAWTRKGKLYEAIEAGNLAAVTRLADSVDVTSSGYGRQPLLAAVYHGKKDIADFMIRRGANFADFYRDETITGDQWLSLLHVAAAQGHKDIVLLLLDHDQYDRTLVNKKDGQHNTALHLAAAEGHKEVVQILLDAGFDPAATGANSKLAIGYANQRGHTEIVEMLKNYKKPQPAIVAAPAVVETSKHDAEAKWKLASADSVAQVCEMKDLGYRITEVFNFASRERIRIVNNLKTKADNVETTSFDSLPDRAQLEEAFAALKKLGGKADPKSVDGKMTKFPRITPPPEAKA